MQMLKEFKRLQVLEYTSQIVGILISLLIMLIMAVSCNTKIITNTTVNKTDTVTTYIDSIIYNYIKRDSIVKNTNVIYKDSVVYKDSVAYKVRTEYKGKDIHIPAIEATIGLAYGKAWVDSSELHLFVKQNDSILETKLDSLAKEVYIRDSVIQTINTNTTSKERTFFDDVKMILILALLILIALAFIKR
jgi:hypothetical protein